jgi:hypothetical protein
MFHNGFVPCLTCAVITRVRAGPVLARRADAIEQAAPPRRHLNNTLRALASLPVRLHLAGT